MATGEDQPQPVVLNALVVPRCGVLSSRVDGFSDIVQRVEPGTPAHAVDSFEATGRDQPCPGIDGHALPRPLFQCGSKGFMQCLLGEVEVAEQADQGGED